MSENAEPAYGRIYDTDLVFEKDCWKLCGDAHCCSFSRYKSRFQVIARSPFQELPLLPGEHAFLQSRGWLDQFGDYTHKVVEFPIDGYELRVESIVSRRPVGCVCNHDTRPTVCRLYPLLPVFQVDGSLAGVEPLGIYEEMERIAGLQPACMVERLSFAELNKFLLVANEIAADPARLFYMMAYRVTRKHVAARLEDRLSKGAGDVFGAFEAAFIRNKLLDSAALREELSGLARQFEGAYGEEFSGAMKASAAA